VSPLLAVTASAMVNVEFISGMAKLGSQLEFIAGFLKSLTLMQALSPHKMNKIEKLRCFFRIMQKLVRGKVQKYF
jgi:hypothetical protein